VRAIRTCAAAALLVGPAALAFASGGYFADARLWAALCACLLAAAGALVAPRPLPRSMPGRIALAGLAGLLVWTIVSRSWAPVVGAANADAQRIALYLAALVAAVALLRGAAARWAEPALGAGIVVVVAYGLTERLLPGVVELDHLRAAMGRLAQPLTYWNAMGALAALGLVLAARLAGDVARPLRLRIAAGCVAAPLGAGLVLAFSRGAIAAAVIGLVVLWALFPTAAQLRAVVVVALAAAAAGAVAALLPGVRTVEGDLGERELGGLLLAAALVAAAVAAGVAVARVARLPDTVRRRLPPAVAVAGVVLGLGLVLAAAALEGETRSTDGATAARLGSAESNRYAYWRVAVDTFAEAPLRGHGSGSFGVLWLRHRTVPEAVRDAHSLELETAAELGLVGLVFLSLLLGGVAASTVLARRRDAAAAAGPAAVLAAGAAHSAVDWDWEMPALTLVAVLLAGLLLARAEPD
jgi:hypothetical protein